MTLEALIKKDLRNAALPRVAKCTQILLKYSIFKPEILAVIRRALKSLKLSEVIQLRNKFFLRWF